ncbi:MAG TPA: CSLREA domain-containing protein, partial [Chthoniobacterales bacterium]
MRTQLILFAALLLAPGNALRAATFNISDQNPAGLKAALAQSNTNNEDDVINLASQGTYVLSTVDNTDGGANGLPVLVKDGADADVGHTLVINGNGATIARSDAQGTPDFRILRISNFGAAASNSITISHLTFANGSSNGPAHTSGDSGGAAYVNGWVLMNECTFRDNYALSGGGAIWHTARTLTLRNCTFFNNDAGGIATVLLNNNQDVVMENCTVLGQGTYGDLLNVGSVGGPKLTLTSCTLLNASVRNYQNPYLCETTLGNTILANSHLYRQYEDDERMFDKFTSLGYNLSTGDAEGWLNAQGDQINADPKLDPLGPQEHGGYVQTIALTAGSAAIDRGSSMGSIRDARGAVRPYDTPNVPNAAGSDASDVGAYESGNEVLQAGTAPVVNTTADHDDGTCGILDCTLREAVERTNALPGANTITFAPGLAGTITLSAGFGGTLIVREPTTITGPGARNISISGNNSFRIFLYATGAGYNYLSGLTITAGRNTPVGRPGASAVGGAILNQTTLTVSDCAFTGNHAVGAPGLFAGEAGGTGNGGAVANQYYVTFNRCTFSGNDAAGAAGAANPESSTTITTGGAGGSGRGGAVYNQQGTVAFYDCTFNGNTATGGAGGSGHFGGAGGAARGGAVHNAGQMVIHSSTISGNTGMPGAGGAGSSSINNGQPGIGIGGVDSAAPDAVASDNSIIAANLGANGGGPDIQGAFDSQGYNLIGNGDFGSGFTAEG